MACRCGKKKRQPRRQAEQVRAAQTSKVAEARVAYQRTLADLKAKS